MLFSLTFPVNSEKQVGFLSDQQQLKCVLPIASGNLLRIPHFLLLLNKWISIFKKPKKQVEL